MARNWQFYATGTMSAGDTWDNDYTQFTQSPHDNAVYFYPGLSQEVYRYNGSVLSDTGLYAFITGSYTNPEDLQGIAYFDEQIFVTFSADSGNQNIIAAYDIDGDSWSEAHDFGVVSGGIGGIWADNDIMVCDAATWHQSTNGTAWTESQFEGSPITAGYAVSINKQLQNYETYSLIMMGFDGGGAYTPYRYNGGLWQKLRESSTARPKNYFDDLAIYDGKPLTDKNLYKTDLWADPLTLASNATGTTATDQWLVQSFGDTARFAYYRDFLDTDEWPFEYNGITGLYEGNTAESFDTLGFWFVLGINVYFAKGGEGNDVIFYSGGTYTPPTYPRAQLYVSSTPGGPMQFKTDLPFSGVMPQAMALRESLGTLVLAGLPGGENRVIYLNHPYSSYQIMDDGLTTGTAPTAAHWI